MRHPPRPSGSAILPSSAFVDSPDANWTDSVPFIDRPRLELQTPPAPCKVRAACTVRKMRIHRRNMPTTPLGGRSGIAASVPLATRARSRPLSRRPPPALPDAVALQARCMLIRPGRPRSDTYEDAALVLRAGRRVDDRGPQPVSTSLGVLPPALARCISVWHDVCCTDLPSCAFLAQPDENCADEVGFSGRPPTKFPVGDATPSVSAAPDASRYARTSRRR